MQPTRRLSHAGARLIWRRSASQTKVMTLNLQPVLSDDLVRLRPLRTDDFAALFAAASDPLMWAQHPVQDRYQEATFRTFFADAMASGGALLIEDASTHAVIGSSRYAGYLPAQREVEIGWTFLSRAYWGGPYNAAIKALMLDHAFETVDSVVFRVGAQNIRSQRAVRKLGAVLEGPTSAGGAPGVCFRLTRAAHVARRAVSLTTARATLP
jgi:N-acetyltransferase